MAICPYCGSQIGDQAEICGFCGGKLNLEPAAAPEEIVRELPEVETESEYEGIPDDILGSVLGSLGVRSVPAESAPEPPEAAPAGDPAAEEITEPPAAEEAPEVPAAEVPVIPAAEESPARPAEQPAYAQPVYAQPAAPKKKNSWVLPAVIIAALALIGILFFATRGGGSKADDPNLGVYRATVVEMYGMQLDADDIYENGFTIELKSNGVCEIDSDGQKGRGKWTLEGEEITIDDGHSTITGTLSKGVLTLENMLDMDLNMTMEKQE